MGTARTLFLSLMILALGAFSVACDDGGDDGTSDAASGDMATGDSTGTDLVAAGRALYEGGVTPACSGCHGPNGSEMTVPGSTNLTIYTGGDAGVRAVLANGGATMPAYPDLSEEEISALSAYVQFLAQ